MLHDFDGLSSIAGMQIALNVANDSKYQRQRPTLSHGHSDYKDFHYLRASVTIDVRKICTRNEFLANVNNKTFQIIDGIKFYTIVNNCNRFSTNTNYDISVEIASSNSSVSISSVKWKKKGKRATSKWMKRKRRRNVILNIGQHWEEYMNFTCFS